MNRQYLLLVVCSFLVGCATPSNIIVLHRTISPDAATFIVVPASMGAGETAFAAEVEGSLLRSGEKVLDHPALKYQYGDAGAAAAAQYGDRTGTAAVASGSRSGEIDTESLSAKTKADFIVYTEASYKGIRIIERPLNRVVSVFMVPPPQNDESEIDEVDRLIYSVLVAMRVPVSTSESNCPIITPPWVQASSQAPKPWP